MTNEHFKLTPNGRNEKTLVIHNWANIFAVHIKMKTSLPLGLKDMLAHELKYIIRPTLTGPLLRLHCFRQEQ